METGLVNDNSRATHTHAGNAGHGSSQAALPGSERLSLSTDRGPEEQNGGRRRRQGLKRGPSLFPGAPTSLGETVHGQLAPAQTENTAPPPAQPPWLPPGGEMSPATHGVRLLAGKQGAGEPKELHGHLQHRGHVLPPAVKTGQQGPQPLAAHRDPLPASRQATCPAAHPALASEKDHGHGLSPQRDSGLTPGWLSEQGDPSRLWATGYPDLCTSSGQPVPGPPH